MKNKLSTLGLVLILSALIVTSCGPRAAQPTESPTAAPTEVAPKEIALTELVSGNSAFAFDLYQAIREKEGNLFYSPYSISLALAMTYAGAGGETERQMAETLHYTLPQENLHPAFNALDIELASRGETADEERGRFQLNIANSMRFLDFVNETEKSRGIINHWVSDETERKIKDLLQPGVITPDTRLVLANAIYFDAKWSFPLDKAFLKESTHDAVFRLLDGGVVIVPMMEQTDIFGLVEGDGYRAVELPYARGEASMVILLPAAGRFEEFESSLDAERVDAIVQELHLQKVALTMPKFRYDSRLSLKETLAEMGMPDAFTGAADFSGMTGSRDLFISGVEHKAFVSVDEAGTEAAAATAEVAVEAEVPLSPPIKVTKVHFSFGANVIASGAKQSPPLHLGIASSQKALLAMTGWASPRSRPQSKPPRSKLRGISSGNDCIGGCRPQPPAGHSSPQQAVGHPGKSSEIYLVTIYHPFIFVIRDIETGAILFVGRVVNPIA